MKTLRLAVEKYRTNPAAYQQFGKWESELYNFDPYQDGKASQRMGNYIGWVYEGINSGKSKQIALISANVKFEFDGEIQRICLK